MDDIDIKIIEQLDCDKISMRFEMIYTIREILKKNGYDSITQYIDIKYNLNYEQIKSGTEFKEYIRLYKIDKIIKDGYR